MIPSLELGRKQRRGFSATTRFFLLVLFGQNPIQLHIDVDEASLHSLNLGEEFVVVIFGREVEKEEERIDSAVDFSFCCRRIFQRFFGDSRDGRVGQHFRKKAIESFLAGRIELFKERMFFAHSALIQQDARKE